MKRWFTFALAFLILLSPIDFSIEPAFAESVEDETSAPVEEDAQLAEDIGVEGLTVELEAPEGESEGVEAAGEVIGQEADAGADAPYYGLLKDQTPLFPDKGGEGALLTLTASGTALILGAEDGWTKVAFNTERGVATGYVASDAVQTLDNEEVNAFLDALAVSGDCVLYDGSLSTPLATLACAFPEAEQADEEKTEEEQPEEEQPEEKEPEEEKEQTPQDGGAAEDESEAGIEEEDPEVGQDSAESMDAAAGFVLKDPVSQLCLGDSWTVSAKTAAGATISASKLTVASGDSTVLSVTGNNVVTALKPGSTWISVTYQGQEIKNDIVVPNEPERISLNVASGTLGVKETYKGLQVIAYPEGTAASVTWSTSNKKIATVAEADGVVTVTGVKKGSAEIIATTRNGRKAVCKVTVKGAPAKVSVALSKSTISVGDTATITPSVSSLYVCSTYAFTTSNKAVATVDENGTITGVGTGTANISAVTYNGKSASAKITVYALPATVAFPEETMSVTVGQTVKLAAAAFDAKGNETVTTMTFSLDAARSDANCVRLDAKTGELKGIKAGTAVVLATAHNGTTGACTITVRPAPKAVELNASSGTIGLKETYKGLKATLAFADGTRVTDGELTWKSSNAKIVSVNEKTGEIYGAKVGSANITATASNGVSASCRVTVCKAPTKIALNPASLKLSVGGMTAKLDVVVPDKSACSSVTFRSSNTKVATVDQDGVVTSVGEGQATIVAESYNGKRSSCAVTVLGLPAKVTMTSTDVKLSEGQTVTLGATATSANGGEAMANYTYYIDSASPNASCITLDAQTGAVTARKKGTAIVGVRAHNGVAAAQPCTVTVVSAPASVILPDGLTLGVGDSHAALAAQVKLSSGEVVDAAGLTWSSDKPKYLAIDASTGEMKALKKGTVTVTAQTFNGKKGSCTVTVLGAPSKITVSPATLKLAAGGMKFALQTTLTKNTTSTITFYSSDTKVATVDANGVITTVNKGTATIYAVTSNNKGATCALTVTGKPTKASFATSSVTLSPSESVTPKVNVYDASGSAAMADLTFNIVSGGDCISIDPATGEITALKAGQAVVNVQTHNGVTSTNTFTVYVKGSNNNTGEFRITNGTEIRMGVGQIHTIEVAGGDSVTWTSSDESVAQVSKKGMVGACKTGTVNIVGTNTKGRSVTCKITVLKAPSKVSLSPADGTLNVGATGEYEVIIPSNTYGSFTFKSSDPSIASVTDDGVVTAHSAGKVTITVTSHNGKTATATLTVKDPDSVDVPEEIAKLGVASYTNYYNSRMTNAQKLEYVIYVGQTQLGMPYGYGGGYSDPDPEYFDCSGFVYWCFYHIGIKLGDSAYAQGYDSRYKKISSISDLKRGDVVCFNTNSSDSDLSDHVGIYLGKGKSGKDYFIHASSGSSKMKVLVQSFTGDSISGDYYTRTFSWGRRILE